ncbi:MAG: DUF1553 domain-containing protein [Zavarzinella sp.]
MPTCSIRWLFLLSVVACTTTTAFADLYNNKPQSNDGITLPKPEEVASIAGYPEKVHIKGMDDAAQLIVTATLKNSRLQDLSGDVQYSSSNPKAARVLPSGRVLPVGNGATEITATYGNQSAKVQVTVTDTDVDLPINFPNQIVPIFTKLGCNSGGCHGKASGQNGFKLSLLGFEPDTDFESLVKETRGRRLMPTSPDASLFLTKGTGLVPHGGGKKMEKDSDEYKLVRRWIASGMPYGAETDPTVTKISVYPPHRILSRNNRQQFSVYAHYSDGSTEDITRRAQYESNDQEIATVDETAVVRTLGLSGEAAIMARYQGQVAVFRATVPLDVKTPEWTFPVQTVVDEHTTKKWRDLGLVPSDLATDTEFVRRAYLDICGTLPTPAQVTAYVENKDPNKRSALVDQLVDSEEYSYYFANKWADILRVKRGGQNAAQRAQGTFAFHGWIRDAIAKDKPYDEFVRDILGATGDETKAPPTVWYKDLNNPEQFVDDTAQVFLGLRIACANCHHHPYEKWSQDDYWGLAAFFGRIGKKNIRLPGAPQNVNTEVIFTRSNGSVTNKRTNKPAEIKPLDGEPVVLQSGQDPRQKLVDWMVEPKNPFFARAVANRYWAHFFGRGIVDPLDDMRVTNPPSNPELLDALAKNLIDNKFSLKELVKTICKSRTYQISANPNEFNQHDKQAYARYYPKRMSAEVLLDAVNQVTNSPTVFNNLPRDRFAPNRAIMLPDESFTSYFLDVFGRPQRISACECERVSEANLAQALHLLNSSEIQGKLTQGGSRASLLADAKDTRADAEKVTELFMWAFGRKPSESDMATALEHITKNEKTKKTAYENILWALINTKEFQFNR